MLIVGAEEAGYSTLEEVAANPQLSLLPMGIVNDDPAKHGLHLHDCYVLGSREDIPDLVRELCIDRVILALPSASDKTMRDILAICRSATLLVWTR